MPKPISEITTMQYGGGCPKKFLHDFMKRNERDISEARAIAEKIVDDVRHNGDKAVLSYTKELDGAVLSPNQMLVKKTEISEAYTKIDPKFFEVLKRAIKRVRAYHEKQKVSGWLDVFGEGEMMGQMVRPIESCGVYVPGGTAPLVSSLIMLTVPAKTAGVKKLVVTTPPGKNGKIDPSLIVAAIETGVDEIYKVGGAQAIAAMAFGTETIPKVDKIVGPWSIYVIMAQRAVYGYVGIASLPGPSEIVVIADETASAGHVAADMLSQAEHGETSSSILITDSRSLVEKVQKEVIKQAKNLTRRDIIAASLAKNGLVIIVDDILDAVKLSDVLAPEHLALEVAEPLALLSRVNNAGAVFLGHETPEPLGDYMAGPSHVLPTETTARFFSPISVDDFIKKTSVIYFDKHATHKIKDDVISFAETEGLTAHANAVRVRG